MKKQMRSSLQNLSISYEFVLAIGNSLNLSEMLHEVIYKIVHKTNAHRGIIWVKNEEKKLQPVASAGINIEEVPAQSEIMNLRDVLHQIQKSRQFVLKFKDDNDFLQYCPVLSGKEESVLIVPVTDVAIIHLVYAGREIADKPLANLLTSLSRRLSVAIEACTAYKSIINEVQVRKEAEKELKKKTEQLISGEKELQRLYGESEQARKSLLSILEDVARKEEALRESEENYRSLFENAVLGIYKTTPDGQIISVNPALLKMLGYSSLEELQHRNLEEEGFNHEYPRSKFKQKIEEEGIIVGMESEWSKADGITLSVRENAIAVCDSSSKVLYYEGTVEDITERKKTEEEMQRLAAIVKYSSELVNLSTLDGRMIFLNESGGKMLGIEPHEVENVNIMEVIPNHLIGLVEKELLPALIKGRTWKGDLQYRNMKTGKLTNVHAVTFTIKDPDTGDPQFLANVSLDITKRKQAEEELFKSEEKHRTLFETMAQGVVYQDKDGKITSANPATERILGLTIDQMQGRKSIDPRWRAIHEDGSDFSGDTHPAMIALKTGKEVNNVKMGVFNPQLDEYRWININARLKFKSDEGDSLQVYTTFDDITERKQAEEELKQKVKQLERFNKVAVDRERRMIELKREINDLLEKAGLEKKYSSPD